MKVLDLVLCVFVVLILAVAAMYIIPFALSILGAIIFTAVPFILIAVILALIGGNKN